MRSEQVNNSSLQLRPQLRAGRHDKHTRKSRRRSQEKSLQYLRGQPVGRRRKFIEHPNATLCKIDVQLHIPQTPLHRLPGDPRVLLSLRRALRLECLILLLPRVCVWRGRLAAVRHGIISSIPAARTITRGVASGLIVRLHWRRRKSVRVGVRRCVVAGWCGGVKAL